MSDGKKTPKKPPGWARWGILGGRCPSRGHAGAAVRVVDMPQLTGGVLHTKFWLVDGTHLYIGSANMDWRSLTQVSDAAAPSHHRMAPNMCRTALGPSQNQPPIPVKGRPMA